MTERTIHISETWGKPLPPEDIVFQCVICQEDRIIDRWRRDGRSRDLPPICLHCEQMWGGTNLSSWIGPRMDARIARQIKAAAECLQVEAYRKINRSKQHAA